MSPVRSTTESPAAAGALASAGAAHVGPDRAARVRRAWLGSPIASRALVAAPMVLFALLAWSRRWTSEDGFIYYRIVGNLLNGDGPVFNVGERVEAYTGPLWLAALALGRALTPAGVHLEWIGVILGLVMSVAGLGAAVWAAWRLWSPPGHAAAGTALPLGALVIAALPPFWDFATSGLETGLAFLWLGGSFLGLVRLATCGAQRSAAPLAVAIGLGPLVRPDLALFALAYLGVLLMLARPRTLRRSAGLVGLAAAVPLGLQLFRMGYFGALVPNTALAKEASASLWARGWEYLVDFLAPYALWLPLAALGGYAVLAASSLWRRGERDRALLVAVPLAAGLLHALYVVRLGGDYMHARVLLPSAFGLLLPVAVVVPARARIAALLCATVVAWALVCSLALRAPADLPSDPAALQVNDQRRRYADLWELRHPVTLDGLLAEPRRRPAVQRRTGLELARLAARTRAIVLDFPGPRNELGERLRMPRPLADVVPKRGVEPQVVAWHGSVGRVGYAAGPYVHLVDPNGLADPLASRTRLPARRPTRPGHEKHLPREWVLARFATPVTPAGAALLARDPDVAAARRALGCEPLRELIDATSDDLTLGRFFANVGYAVSGRSLRFSRDPRRAAAELCRPR